MSIWTQKRARSPGLIARPASLMVRAERRLSFRLISGEGDAVTTPIHIAVDGGPFWPALVFDGSAALADGAKVPTVSGLAILTGSAAGPDGPLPWRVAGPMSANLDAATLANAEFRFGFDERAVRAEGDATLNYGLSAGLSLKLKAKQANVDALLRRKGEDSVPPERAVTVLTAALGPALAGMGGLIVGVDVAAKDVILGSELMTDLSASMNVTPGAPIKTRFDIGLPGRNRFKADGEFETGSVPKFRGAVDFSADDLSLLRDWAIKGAPDFAARATAMSDAFAVRSVSLLGDVEASTVGFSGRSLRLALDRTTLTGSLAFTDRVGSEPGRLYLDSVERLADVATLPTLSASETLLGDLDLSIALRAKSLHVSRAGEGEIDSGSLGLKVKKSGPKATLEQLNVSNLGGASVEARGTFGPDGVEATGHLGAAKLRDFALLVFRLAPSEWSKALVERAPLLSPASLAFEFHGGLASDGDPVFKSLRANGTIGQTRTVFAVDPAPNGKGQTIALDLDAPEAGALLRQLGLFGFTGSSGHAEIGLHANGAWGADTTSRRPAPSRARTCQLSDDSCRRPRGTRRGFSARPNSSARMSSVRLRSRACVSRGDDRAGRRRRGRDVARRTLDRFAAFGDDRGRKDQRRTLLRASGKCGRRAVRQPRPCPRRRGD